MVIDIETGAYEIDRDELAASDQLLARRLDAQMWTRRVGSQYACRFRLRYKRMDLSDYKTITYIDQESVKWELRNRKN